MIRSKKRKFIDEEFVKGLRDLGLGWKEIAEHPDVNVSLSTLLRWRKEMGFSTTSMDELSCTQLDTLVSDHIIGQPRRGEIMIRSYMSWFSQRNS